MTTVAEATGNTIDCIMEVAFHRKERDHAVPGSGNLFSREKRLHFPGSDVPRIDPIPQNRSSRRVFPCFRTSEGTTPPQGNPSQALRAPLHVGDGGLPREGPQVPPGERLDARQAAV